MCVIIVPEGFESRWAVFKSNVRVISEKKALDIAKKEEGGLKALLEKYEGRDDVVFSMVLVAKK